MPNYAPTINPGDTRRRTRYIGISTPLNQVPSISVLEQEVVRLANGETLLAELGNVPVTAFDPAETFPLRDYDTDAELGQTATVGQALTLVYSWVRKQQLVRDAAETAAP